MLSDLTSRVFILECLCNSNKDEVLLPKVSLYQQGFSTIFATAVIEIMAGPETDAQFQFTGIKKYFNSYTLTGRMNCVLATYGGIALLVLYFKLRSKKTPAVKAT
ncbi:ATP synthase membrane subunit K, mitochondrial isoform X1 [Trichechus manatus latirostris]|nr:ATP synthase membrane subunit K, mitochondrial isoform X1 [Trichechus manatus latirostris]